ncbi:hypothetical protein [Streptomyces sp. NPDC002187]
MRKPGCMRRVCTSQPSTAGVTSPPYSLMPHYNMLVAVFVS